MRLLEVLQPEHIIAPLKADTFRGAVLELVKKLVDSGTVPNPDRLDRLATEERIRDVVHVGDRVLLPHLRTDAVERLVVAIGVSAVPIRFGPDAEAGKERVVVLVLAPPAASNHYLQMVAALSRALRSDGTVERLVEARSPAEVLDIQEIRDLVVQPRLTVRDIMTQRVYRVYPNTPVDELLELMSRHDLKSVPVVGDKREVLGVVTDRDLLRHLMPTIMRMGSGERAEPRTEERSAYDVPVRDIMSRSVMCISEDQALSEIVSIMINKDVERLPVVAEGRLTGFLTRGDVLRKLFGE